VDKSISTQADHLTTWNDGENRFLLQIAKQPFQNAKLHLGREDFWIDY
jgi:hypothetical protein